MDRRPKQSLLRRAVLLATIVAALLSIGVATAGAASSIEGVWAFNGGQIAVQPLSNSTFVGTVVTETKFAECTHPVGQQIWSGITPQADGSFWGLHQWYFEKSECRPNPTLGLSAFRVMAGSNGSSYLRVCLSSPGTAQPTIDASGYSANATYGCFDSALSAPLPPAETSTGTTPKAGTENFKELVTVPSNAKCFSSRSFQIHVLDPKYDAFKTVSITIKGRKLKTARHGDTITATVSLKGLPKGAFTVDIKATTYLGRRLSGSRTYHTCAVKAVHHKASLKLG